MERRATINQCARGASQLPPELIRAADIGQSSIPSRSSANLTRIYVKKSREVAQLELRVRALSARAENRKWGNPLNYKPLNRYRLVVERFTVENLRAPEFPSEL